ncbi:hypothetical protein ACOMHN_064599 [Nucella lapillus]
MRLDQGDCLAQGGGCLEHGEDCLAQEGGCLEHGEDCLAQGGGCLEHGEDCLAQGGGCLAEAGLGMGPLLPVEDFPCPGTVSSTVLLLLQCLTGSAHRHRTVPWTLAPGAAAVVPGVDQAHLVHKLHRPGWHSSSAMSHSFCHR